jgi:hypothetical protein
MSDAAMLAPVFVHVVRLFAFGVGLATLAAMWLWFALRLYVTG